MDKIQFKKFDKLGVHPSKGEITGAEFTTKEIEVLEEILTGLKFVKKKGFPLPGKIVPWELIDKGYAGWHSGGSERGTLGMGIKGEYRPSYDGWIVDPSMTGIITHECGHLYHYLHNRKTFDHPVVITDQLLKPFETSMQYIRSNVSQYALENTGEFVAEVFCGTLMGKKYPPKIVAVFHNYVYSEWKASYKI